MKLGRLAKASLLQQKSQWLQAKLQVEEQKIALVEAEEKWRVTLGLPVTAGAQLHNDLGSISAFKLWPLQQSIDYALAHNLSYQQQQLTDRMTARQLRIAKDAQRWQFDVVSMDNQGERHVRMELSVPIHDMVRKQQQVNATLAKQQSQLSLKQARQALVAEVTSAWTQCQTQLKRIAMMEMKQVFNERNYQIALKKHALGRASAFEVSQQQTDRVNDAVSLIQLKVSYLSSLVNLHTLEGRLLFRFLLMRNYLQVGLILGL